MCQPEYLLGAEYIHNNSPNHGMNKIQKKKMRRHVHCSMQRVQNTRRGRQVFRSLCCEVFGLLKNQFLRNNNNKGSRSNVNKYELVNGESSSNARDARCLFIICYCLQSLLLLLRKNQSKNVTAKCTNNLSPPPCILFSLQEIKI